MSGEFLDTTEQPPEMEGEESTGASNADSSSASATGKDIRTADNMKSEWNITELANVEGGIWIGTVGDMLDLMEMEVEDRLGGTGSGVED